MDRRRAARSILARAATANTPGPLNFNCKSAAPLAVEACTAAANAARIDSTARSCASVSEPAAAVCATIRARAPSEETQTPPLVAGTGVRSS